MTMPLRRDPRTGGWFSAKPSDGKTLRLFGTPGVSGPSHDLAATKVGAVGATEAEQRAIHEVMTPEPEPTIAKEKPTFADWFEGRFWREW
jgi:hypothetical protein